MSEKRPIPWPGITLALASGVFLALADVDLWAILGVLALWIGSLWISRPEMLQATPLSDNVQLSRDSMRELVEHSGTAQLVLDRNRIIVANAAAREALGDHVLGQDVRVALRHPAAVALLDQPHGGSATIRGLSAPRSIWQVNRQPIDGRYWMVELINRTAEADISRAHTDFVAHASHELRTPLASIIGYIETLADDGTTIDPATASRFHQTVLKEAHRLQSLVDDLMSLSRVEAEKHDLPGERVELNDLVAAAAMDAGSPDDRHRVVVQQAPSPLPIYGDHQQMEQLVRNLVDNALKYGHAHENVVVSLERQDEHHAEIKVTDKGDGISPEHIPHLTRRFYRTDPGRSRASGGTGLGLAIVKHIVERHRGHLEITSKQGQGTCISVGFPLIEQD